MKRFFFQSLLVFALIMTAVFLRESGRIGFPPMLAVLLGLFALELVFFHLAWSGFSGPVKNIRRAFESFSKTKAVEKIIPKEGDEDMQFIISALNKMMLQLQAYNCFRLDQVLDERNKADAMMDVVPDAMVLINANGAIMHCNRPFQALTGISPADKTECKTLKDSPFKNILLKMLSSSEKKAEIELPCEDPRRIYLFSCQRFLISSLKQEGLIVIIRDITLEKELETAKEDFFHMITHDMRAPLSTIKGYAEILMKILQVSTSQKGYFDNIIYAQKKLAGMIDDILNIMKLESGRMEINPEKMRAGAFLAAIRESQMPVAQLKTVEISAAVQGEDFEFSADKTLVERVMTNLLTNALKFTPQEGKITMGASNSGNSCEFWVEDSGPGIPEGKREIVFKKYVQMEEHRTQGFGLGLAMCKLAVELHKGSIRVESEVGKGSKFIFKLPLKQG